VLGLSHGSDNSRGDPALYLDGPPKGESGSGEGSHGRSWNGGGGWRLAAGLGRNELQETDERVGGGLGKVAGRGI
jgi:hypothetical protein